MRLYEWRQSPIERVRTLDQIAQELFSLVSLSDSSLSPCERFETNYDRRRPYAQTSLRPCRAYGLGFFYAGTSLSVCLSVRPKKKKDSCASILIHYERPFALALWQEEWLVGIPKNLGQTGRIVAKSPIFSS